MGRKYGVKVKKNRFVKIAMLLPLSLVGFYLILLNISNANGKFFGFPEFSY